MEIDRDGRKWRTLLSAATFLRVTRQTVLAWAKECEWLSGAGIETWVETDGLGRDVPHYLLDDLKRIKEAKARRKQVPDVAGHTYFKDLATELGFHERSIRKMFKRIGKVKLKKVPGKAMDGLGRRRSYIPNWACQRLRKLYPARVSTTSVADKAKPLRSNAPAAKKERMKRASDKHLQWSEWRSKGLSYQQIALEWQTKTHEITKEDTVKKALKRLAAR